jgi:hypothetical protein
MMSQPRWKLLDNLGDADPLDYGGYFVYVDETGVYAPEAELLEVIDDEEKRWEVRRFSLEPCTFQDGILSDNKYHPDHAAWFATPEECPKRKHIICYLSNVATACDIDLDELRGMFCSDDVLERAQAYRMVGQYHGFDNLDSYPQVFTDRKEVASRYK